MKKKDLRTRTLILSSWVSTIGNAILSISKITIGLLSGSLAVISDGIDSASDVVISLVMLFTSRIISRPPDRQYVYGYEKAESIATKVLSLVIFYAGLQMLISTIDNLFTSSTKQMPGLMAIYVTVFSIIGKLGLALYQYRQGKKVDSSLLMANAKNMRNDVIISVGVMLGLVFTFTLNLPILDTITGLIISLFIIRTAVKIFIESNVELMDGVHDTSVYNKIFEAVDRVPQASNPHRVRSRQMGNMYLIALDIEVNGDMTLNKAHEIANAVENSIKQSIENVYDIVVHVEPKGVHHPTEKFGINKEML